MFSGYKPLNTWGCLFLYIKWKLLVPHKLQKFSHESLFGSINRFLHKTAVVFFFFFFSSFSDTLNAFISLVSYYLFVFLIWAYFFMLCTWKTNRFVFGMLFQGKGYYTICDIILWFLSKTGTCKN